ncbi:hypothetical protein HDU82_003124 [Entophlyctis luteolus]|nr:hypothetical protein HDU82_003124 [Entophlyctis luteolus]
MPPPTTLPPAGKWLYVPEGIADVASEYAASIGYSDFFVSELTSDSEDSQTGAKLTLAQRRRRHEERRKKKAGASKWGLPPPSAPAADSRPSAAVVPAAEEETFELAKTELDMSAVDAAVASIDTAESTTGSKLGFVHAPGTPENLLDALAALSTRITTVLTLSLSADAATRNAQLEGVGAALGSATFVLDNIDGGGALSEDANSVLSAGGGRRGDGGDSAEARAAKLAGLADRMRLLAEKTRDQAATRGGAKHMHHVSLAARHAEKQKERQVDALIRRTEREMRKVGA